jgi:hypothetical protein
MCDLIATAAIALFAVNTPYLLYLLVLFINFLFKLE